MIKAARPTGGRLEGDGDVTEALNLELQERWNMTVSIDKCVGWLGSRAKN
jgi:hypothetical protein